MTSMAEGGGVERLGEARLLGYDGAALVRLVEQLVPCARELAALGWTPATSGNFSMRLDERHVAITISGRDKGRTTPQDIVVVDLGGQVVGSDRRADRPSAEVLLHTQLYRRFDNVGCVLHTHSITQTVASRLFAPEGRVRLHGYELLKAIGGTATHDATIDLPVIGNGQHMPGLAERVERFLEAGPIWGYLIDGHGLYAWGVHLAEARRHLEAFEFLLGCELEMRKVSR